MRKITYLFFLFVLLTICSHVVAQSNTIQLRNGITASLSPLSNCINQYKSSKNTGGAVLLIADFGKKPNATLLNQLETNGIKVIEPISATQFVIELIANKTPQNNLDYNKITAAYILPEWKCDKNVLNNSVGTTATIVFYPSASKEEIIQLLTQYNCKITSDKFKTLNTYGIEVNGDAILKLAAKTSVKNIGRYAEPSNLDLQTHPIHNMNIAAMSVANGGYNLNGKGVFVGVGDDAPAIFHADTKDKVINYHPGRMRNHGAHINGIIGSMGIVNPLSTGIASGVTLIDHQYDQVIATTPSMYATYGMNITNNSYGVLLSNCDYSGTYDGYSYLLDSIALLDTNVLHVFASGNDGQLNCSGYPQGYATTAGGYQPSKNALVTGSIDKNYVPSPTESKGPVKDGRLKPEMTAVGVNVFSTLGIDSFVAASGTSMASPQVAGAAALLTQRYKQLYNKLPKADLLKAILLNGTTDKGNPGPDYTYGFGVLNVDNSLQILNNQWYNTGALANGENNTFTINVPANTATLKVMLYWHDKPGSLLATKELINDLDLTVTQPGGTVRKPYILGTNTSNVTDNASEGEDHINNVEQVIVNTPASGVYTIKINGTAISGSTQGYVVSYITQPKGLSITYPTSETVWNNTDSLRINWQCEADGKTSNIFFSSDNGGTWTEIASNIKDSQLSYSWLPNNINSGLCRIKISKSDGSYTQTTPAFVINNTATLQLQPTQCPTYLNVYWNKINNATGYWLYKKNGNNIDTVAFTTDTTYSFKNMSVSTYNYVAVAPVINGKVGYRSKALKAIANSGDCTNLVSLGDLQIASIIQPSTGRQATSTQLGSTEAIRIAIRNLYNTNCNNYTVLYKVNSSNWDSINAATSIAANSIQNIDVANIDLSATGTYSITVVVKNKQLTDPNPGNDTLRSVVENITNTAVTLPYIDDFETNDNINITTSQIGFSNNKKWDFIPSDSFGRMRTYLGYGLTVDGNRSLSIDNYRPFSNGNSYNTVALTLNLSNYDTLNDEVRLDADYVLHGIPKTGINNTVVYKHADTAIGKAIYNYDLSTKSGTKNHITSVSLTDALLSQGRNFSTSAELIFKHNDTSAIADINYGNGISIDNINVYTVSNDVQLTAIVSPTQNSCGITGTQPVTIKVKNGMRQKLYNIRAYYQPKDGSIKNGIIDSIGAKDSINYTFPDNTFSALDTTLSISCWIALDGDTYLLNDSINNYTFRSKRVIDNFPYLEQFETGVNGYFSGGVNNSWAYGTPNSAKINKAASGTKAWKTNLTGRYNNLETSYLYSPCFDISTLENPYLSFAIASDIEDCGTILCDRAYVEYSFDGGNWTRLGNNGEGTNWYDAPFNAWTQQANTRWHVASIALPKPPTGENISIRFVLNSDPGAGFDGVAIDDIHIYDRKNALAIPTNNLTVNTILETNKANIVTANGRTLCEINPYSNNLGNTEVTLFPHENITNPNNNQWILPRNYTIKSDNEINDSIYIKLYVADTDIVRIVNSTDCNGCYPIYDIYGVGVSNYYGTVIDEINNSLRDDTSKLLDFYKSSTMNWIPYDAGYYTTLKIKKPKELWFNSGGPLDNIPAGKNYINFNIRSLTNKKVEQHWICAIDSAVEKYGVERSFDGISYQNLYNVTAGVGEEHAYYSTDSNYYNYNDTVYYRLNLYLKNGDSVYSAVRMATEQADSITDFNARVYSKNTVLLDWTNNLDENIDNYDLLRSINNSAFEKIANLKSVQTNSYKYTYMDTLPSVNTYQFVVYRLLAKWKNTASALVSKDAYVEMYFNAGINNIWPNPSSSSTINISWTGQAGTVLNIEILDITGKKITNYIAQSAGWSNIASINLPNLPSGVYLIKSNIDGNTSTQKFIIEN